MRRSPTSRRPDGNVIRGIILGLPVSLVLWYALTRAALTLTGGL